MSEAISAVNSSSFESEVLQSNLPVLVDFWAEWCGPCRMILPVVEELAAEYAGKVKIVKVNADESQDVLIKYGVRGIPTLALFKNGDLIDTNVGAASKMQLVAFLDKNL